MALAFTDLHAFRRRLNTTLLSRFFLNLREAVLSPNDHTNDRASVPTQTDFASIVFGNIGESLAHGVDDGLDRDLAPVADEDGDEICELEDVTEARKSWAEVDS